MSGHPPNANRDTHQEFKLGQTGRTNRDTHQKQQENSNWRSKLGHPSKPIQVGSKSGHPSKPRQAGKAKPEPNRDTHQNQGKPGKPNREGSMMSGHPSKPRQAGRARSKLGHPSKPIQVGSKSGHPSKPRRAGGTNWDTHQERKTVGVPSSRGSFLNCGEKIKNPGTMESRKAAREWAPGCRGRFAWGGRRSGIPGFRPSWVPGESTAG
ncbi:hypothetical protein SCOR_30780 [Sulfidibacter corallicola]